VRRRFPVSSYVVQLKEIGISYDEPYYPMVEYQARFSDSIQITEKPAGVAKMAKMQTKSST